MLDVRLISPDIEYRDQFVDALRNDLGEYPTPKRNILLAKKDFAAYIFQINDLSIPVTTPDGSKVKRVPQDRWWLVGGGKFLGQISIRHKINEHLRKRGGHIGYGVNKKERCKGYGTLMLKLALPLAKELGLNKVLLTCSDKNIGSAKVIENNGGILEDKISVPGMSDLQYRYWISL